MTTAQVVRVEELTVSQHRPHSGSWVFDLCESDRAALTALLAERTALREALEAALPYVERCYDVSFPDYEENLRIEAEARAALASGELELVTS